MAHAQQRLGVSERRACRALRQPRSSQRYVRRIAEDERRLTARIVALASEYGRYGYRRIAALLRAEGWEVNTKRVQRIWRQEGLRVPGPPRRGVVAHFLVRRGRRPRSSQRWRATRVSRSTRT